MSDVIGSAKLATQSEIEKLGYEIVEISYSKKYGTPTLTFYIDLPLDSQRGVDLNDCEAVSKVIDPLLDAADVTNGVAYNLEVSSSGLDRALTTERDYLKNQGKDIELTFYATYNGKKKLSGLLVSWTDLEVTLSVKGKELCIAKKDIAVIKPVISF